MGADNSHPIKAHNLLPLAALEEVPDSAVSAASAKGTDERPFLFTPYNQHPTDGSYRSPWTNFSYSIELSQEGIENVQVHHRTTPADLQSLRELEAAANEMWDAYVQLYYGRDNAIGSVFLLPSKKGEFDGIFGVRKVNSNQDDDDMEDMMDDDLLEDEVGNTWHSIHYVKVDRINNKDQVCTYHVDSSVLCTVQIADQSTISLSNAKQTSKECKLRMSSLAGSHLENIGHILEDVEMDFRSRMERVQMPSAMEVMESIYRAKGKSATAKLIARTADDDDGDVPSMATGMGVGAGMINEIAKRAKEKRGSEIDADVCTGDNNPFMQAMKANMERKANSTPLTTGEEATYSDLKAGLKKAKVPPSGGRGPAPVMMSPFGDVKATLKKTAQIPKAPIDSSSTSKSATPEFMNFRDKLKKTGK